MGCDVVRYQMGISRHSDTTSTGVVAVLKLQIRQNTADKALALAFSSLPLRWHMNKCVYVDWSHINLFLSLLLKL